jgi:small-conductance mechanosensitive channel
MADWLTLSWWTERAVLLSAWVQDSVLTWPVAGQVAVSGAALAISLFAGARLKRWLDAHGERARWVVRVLSPLLSPLLWLLLTWVALATFRAYGQPSRLLDSIAGLLLAWVVIRLVSQLVRHPIWAGLFVWTIWTIAALNILGWLDPIVGYLQATIVPGATELTLFNVVQAVLLFVVVLSAAVYVTGLLEARIRTSRTLSPLVQVLFLKSLKFVLIAFAVVIAIASLGIDLTTLAVFGGVVGVGIGFGLQRVISNLISGVVLLVDNSIKPGDIIAVSGTYGWVTALGGRYVSVVTRDGVEHLIPNETLITERVENWTHTHSRTRLKVDVSVHYRTDLHRAIALCLEAARQTERVLADPEPKCLLLEFGESGIKLQTRFWIADAHNGVQNVKSDVLLRVWENFKREGIEIPYPQLVLHRADPVLD